MSRRARIRLRCRSSHARRRQLDGQRETVQPTTDRDDGRARSLRSARSWAAPRGHDRRRGGRASEASASSRRTARRGWQLQRWDRELMLTGDVQQRPAGDQNLRCRAVGQQVGDERRGGDDLLEVVEHQEQASRSQVVAQRRLYRVGGGLANAERHRRWWPAPAPRTRPAPAGRTRRHRRTPRPARQRIAGPGGSCRRRPVR